MLRYASTLFLPAVLLLASETAVQAQLPATLPQPGRSPSAKVGLTGTYVNTETGGFCHVYSIDRERGYLFVDDSLQRVRFVPTGPDELSSAMTYGRRVPNISVTTGRNRDGRVVLRFDAAGVTPGFWVAAD